MHPGRYAAAFSVAAPEPPRAMHVSIHFCARCGYEPQAVALAAEVRAHFTEASIDLVPTAEDEFDVKRDDKDVVYEKAKAGRFPRAGEIVDLLGRRPPKAER